MFDIYVVLGFVTYFGLATWAIYHNLLFKRDPRAAWSWIVICMLLPFFGPVLYFLFGINRIQRRARGLRLALLKVDYEIADHVPQRRSGDSGSGLQSIGHTVSGRTLVTGNHVTALYNGDEAYPAMLAAIEQARECIYLASYIFKRDEIGLRFIDALTAAKARGVTVKVIIDGIGNLYSFKRSSRLLRRRGIDVVRFLPPRLLPPSVNINLRNHRKMLVIDDQFGFIGGLNIGDQNMDRKNQLRSVTDLHFRIDGPITPQLTQLFHYDWQYARGGELPKQSADAVTEQGEMACRLIPDGPDESLDALATTIQSVISCAEDRIAIMTPYFLPSREMVSAIQSAAIRGVRVRVVLPAKNNLIYIHWANRNLLSELLNWGVEVRYQPPPFSHSKLLCIDDRYCLIGSANLDPRSLRLNFELGLEVLSAPFNRRMWHHFDQIYQQSTPVTFQELASRSVLVRLRDSLVSLMSPYL